MSTMTFRVSGRPRRTATGASACFSYGLCEPALQWAASGWPTEVYYTRLSRRTCPPDVSQVRGRTVGQLRETGAVAHNRPQVASTGEQEAVAVGAPDRTAD